jgi:capsular polysaccharide biosynthesis protein
LSTLSQICKIDELIELGDASVVFQIPIEAGEVYIADPPFVDPLDLRIDSAELKRQFVEGRYVKAPGRSLTYLTNCYVLPNAAVVTSSGRVVRESCYPYPADDWICRMFAPWISGSGRRVVVETAASDEIDRPTLYVREHGEMGFFHWMHSVLPRLETFKASEMARNFAVLCQNRATYQSAGLQLAGLDVGRLLAPSREHPQFFKQLLFPSPLVDGGDFWLRPVSVARFYDRLRVPTPAGPQRIYVTRRDAAVRRLKNEDQLLDRLGRLGFKAVELAALPFGEQIGLFRASEFVVGVHGAGLSHVSNMPPGGRVLEILHPRRFWPTYRALAARRRLRYGFAVGTDGPPRITGDGFDFEIDVEKVAGLVERMLEKGS